VFEVSAPAGTGVELFQVAGRSLQDAEQWASWYETWRAAVYDVAKSVNWLAAVVRRDFDPSFFLVEGKFILRDGYTRIPEFSDTERAKLP
jgi:hypothetical protein